MENLVVAYIYESTDNQIIVFFFESLEEFFGQIWMTMSSVSVACSNFTYVVSCMVLFMGI